jgi:siroheme synthase (precorrin-2 oxidase/ferrochelatase)
MRYIDKAKVPVFLKLKKQLALFIGTGTYFESRTFNWIKLEYHKNVVRCTFIQSFDEGSELYDEVQSFATVADFENENDTENAKFTEGTLEDCLSWIEKNYTADLNKFVLTENLNELYAELVANGRLGG